MIYVHFCKLCERIYLLNGHKMSCPKCNFPLTELQIPYQEYISMNTLQREALTKLCCNQEELHKISTTYRMYKYSKWYRNLQIIDQDSCQNK